MSPEAKKRCEEAIKEHGLNFGKSGLDDFEAGYQSGYNDPEANKELLDSMRYQARVDLFESIFKNLDEVGFEETLAWMRSRHNFESNKLKAARES